MCGPFTNQYNWREIRELYDLTLPYLDSNLPPRIDVASMQNSFVLRLDKEGARELAELRWGIVLSWSKTDKDGAMMISAKSETVSEKPAFRSAFKSRPCLVFADGFYEWKKLTPKEKQPYSITRVDRKPFAFAELWEWYRAKDVPADASGLETFTILTIEPSALCAEVHNRMPVVLAPEDCSKWLAMPADRTALLRPFTADDAEMWPIGKDVGKVKNTGLELTTAIGSIVHG